MPCALIEAVRERGAAADKTIHVRGLNVGVVQCAYGAERLVIGEEEQDVWPFAGLVL